MMSYENHSTITYFHSLYHLPFSISDGDLPNSRLKLSLKLPRLLKPASMATSAILYSPFFSNVILCRSLAFLIYSLALIPVRAFTLR